MPMDTEEELKVDAFETQEKGTSEKETDDSGRISTFKAAVETKNLSLPTEQAVNKSLILGPEIEATERSTAQKNLRYRNVGGNFITGIDITSEDEIRRREERGKRFGISQKEAEQQQFPKHGDDEEEMDFDVTKLEARSKRFGTELLLANGRPVKIVPSLPSIAEGRIRLKAVHLHGCDEMSTEDILEYFSCYGPRNIEWINDKSCNIVWDDEVSARRALNGLGQQPVAVMASESHTQADSDGQDKLLDGTLREENKKADIGNIVEMRGGVEEKATEPPHKSLDKEEERVMSGGVSDDILWWLATPHPRAKQLLIRHATVGDMKTPGAAKRSQYYKKYGNPNTVEPQQPQDLRDRLGMKRRHSSTEQPDEKEDGDRKIVEDTLDDLDDSRSDPLATLVKRPRRMHADRDEEDEEEEYHLEREAGRETESVGNDLRRLLKKKRKRRDLKMRLGDYPRLVEEQR